MSQQMNRHHDDYDSRSVLASHTFRVWLEI